MAFCTEHPKWDQNPKFSALSETTSIPALFIWESFCNDAWHSTPQTGTVLRQISGGETLTALNRRSGTSTVLKLRWKALILVFKPQRLWHLTDQPGLRKIQEGTFLFEQNRMVEPQMKRQLRKSDKVISLTSAKEIYQYPEYDRVSYVRIGWITLVMFLVIVHNGGRTPA